MLASGLLSAVEPSYAVWPFPTPSPVEAPGPHVTGLAADAPTPSATVLSGYAGTLADDSLIPGATTGVSIIDVATGTELVDHQASAMISFEGETGPYIQYAYARIQSILRKANVKFPPRCNKYRQTRFMTKVV